MPVLAAIKGEELMWRVTLRGVDFRGDDYEHTVKIYSDSAIDLIENREFRWEMLDAMIQRGSLKTVQVHYRPSRS